VIELVEAAAELQEFLVARGWSFCFIGGLALQHWGEQRVTRDVDLTLLTGFGDEARFVDPLLMRYRSRLPEGREFAIRNRVLLLLSGDGIPLDVALGGLPFEAEAVSRAQLVEFAPGRELRICTAEDLVVMKAFADRERDWADIEGVVIRQRGRLDWEYIDHQLAPLARAKEAPQIEERLAAVRGRNG
jgi:predicted nucleotidyltransferase